MKRSVEGCEECHSASQLFVHVNIKTLDYWTNWPLNCVLVTIWIHLFLPEPKNKTNQKMLLTVVTKKISEMFSHPTKGHLASVHLR